MTVIIFISDFCFYQKEEAVKSVIKLLKEVKLIQKKKKNS